jgi:hypothetical protein
MWDTDGQLRTSFGFPETGSADTPIAFRPLEARGRDSNTDPLDLLVFHPSPKACMHALGYCDLLPEKRRWPALRLMLSFHIMDREHGGLKTEPARELRRRNRSEARKYERRQFAPGVAITSIVIPTDALEMVAASEVRATFLLWPFDLDMRSEGSSLRCAASLRSSACRSRFQPHEAARSRRAASSTIAFRTSRSANAPGSLRPISAMISRPANFTFKTPSLTRYMPVKVCPSTTTLTN